MKFVNGLTLGVIITITFGCGAPIQNESVTLDRVDDQIADDLSWVENEDDREQIALLARSGDVKIERNSSQCYGEQTDYLGRGDDDRALCLQQIKLPREVLAEVKIGNEYRFANVSDYDQRVTRLYAFEHNGLLHRFLNDIDIAALTKAFDIPEMIGGPRVEVTTPADFAHLGILDYSVFIGTDYVERSEMLNFAEDFLGDKEAKTFRFGSGVELYPGGGFTTDFAIIVTADKLLFVKVEGWNS